MTFEEAIQKLAAGYRVELRDDEPRIVDSYDIGGPIWDRLIREGWIRSMPCGWVYGLSDDGLKSYLRSTDELGDGVLEITHDDEEALAGP